MNLFDDAMRRFISVLESGVRTSSAIGLSSGFDGFDGVLRLSPP